MTLLRPSTALLAVLALALPDTRALDLLIRDVHVVQGDGRTIARATIAVNAGRISRIDAGATGWRARREIDGTGRTLIPGLIDAHVHVTTRSLPLFLHAGVTTVRDLGSDRAFIVPLAAHDAPDIPRIVASGPIVDGPGSIWPGRVEVETVWAARTAVRDAVRQGATVIATGTQLHPAVLSVIVAEARARGVPVAAHVGRTNAVEASEAGITSLEHLSGIAEAASADPERLRRLHEDFVEGWTESEREWLQVDPVRLQAVTRTLIEHDVVLVPTLVLQEALSRPDVTGSARQIPDSPDMAGSDRNPWNVMRRGNWTSAMQADVRNALPLQQRFVADYLRRGGRVATGTGAPQRLVVPGASLHRELQLLVAGGISPAAALQGATSTAAALLGIAERIGTIDVGKDADLVLLDGDPLRDIRATERIRLVMRSGIVVYER